MPKRAIRTETYKSEEEEEEEREKVLMFMSVMELVYATLLWAIRRGKKVGRNFDDQVGYIGHLATCCMHTTSNTLYTDRAIRRFDKAVRDWAKTNGLSAFNMGDQELNILHFNYENTCPASSYSKEMHRGAILVTQDSPGGDKIFDKHMCYVYNYNKDGGTASKCDYEHKCISCHLSSHTNDNCKAKRH